MKKRFSEEQVIGFQRGGARGAGQGAVPQARLH
jgi:hypothetical protein